MLRAVLINPVLLVIATAIAIAAGRLLGLHPSMAPILVAAGIGLLASEVALVPTLLRPHAEPADRFQRAYLGTVLHLGLAVVLAVAAIFALKLGNSFVFWLLGAYWITLIGLCVVFVRTLRTRSQSAVTPGI